MASGMDTGLTHREARSAMLQAGLDLIDQGFTLFDGELRLVAGNRTFATLLDFPLSMLEAGTPFEAFMRYNAERGEYGPGDVEQLVAERMEAARQFTPHYAERVRPGGQVLAIRGQPLPHRGFVTIYTDITAQREAERVIRERNADLERHVQERTKELEAAYQRLRAINQINEQIASELRRNETRLRLITDAIPALIAYLDKDDVYRFANRGYLQWFGRNGAPVTGRKASEVLGPQLYERLAPFLKSALAGNAVGFEYTAPGLDGESLCVLRCELVPEVGHDGKVLGIYMLSTDITEQKRTQLALMQAQKMEAVGQLAGGIAHDLNNMLTVVLANLVALEERAAGDDAGTELVAPALLATRRAAALIKRLLGFSRQQPLDPQAIDLRMLIEGLKTLLRRSLPENIELGVDFADDLAPVLADPHQLENALLNLSLNARDAMPEGGTLHLWAGTQEVTPEHAVEWHMCPGRYICIALADDGCGMDADTLLRACEPFFTTKRFGSGSGLGLAMVYGFARQSGGGLRIDSAPGQGTTVSLFLPISPEPPPAPDDDTVLGSSVQGQRPLVLLVEDDPDVRAVLRRQLVQLGHPVIEAGDGSEALALFGNIAEIGIVVSDVVMPGRIDGAALARAVRAQRPDIGILLVSGYEKGSTGVGEFKLLNKPFSGPELAAALAELTP